MPSDGQQAAASRTGPAGPHAWRGAHSMPRLQY